MLTEKGAWMVVCIMRDHKQEIVMETEDEREAVEIYKKAAEAVRAGSAPFNCAILKYRYAKKPGESARYKCVRLSFGD